MCRLPPSAIGDLHVPPGPMNLKHDEQVRRAIAIVLAVTALRLPRHHPAMPLLARPPYARPAEICARFRRQPIKDQSAGNVTPGIQRSLHVDRDGHRRLSQCGLTGIHGCGGAANHVDPTADGVVATIILSLAFFHAGLPCRGSRHTSLSDDCQAADKPRRGIDACAPAGRRREPVSPESRPLLR